MKSVSHRIILEHNHMMNSKKICGRPTGYSQFSQTHYSNASDQFGEPNSKKPKLDIAINGYIPKQSHVISKPSIKKEEMDDVWGFEFDVDVIAQVEHDESIALSQITQTEEKKKSGPKVPLRRVGSSQWPSSSHPVQFSSTHSSNTMVSVKGPVRTNGAFLHSDLEKLTLENRRIKEELNKKTGEARILRDKVNSSEREKEKVRKEYSSKLDTLKAEAERNILNLTKEVRSLRGQLDVKNMEIKAVERRSISSSVNRIQPDSPNRLGTSSRFLPKENSPDWELNQSLVSAKVKFLPLKYLRDSMMPELLEPSQTEVPLSEFTRPSNPRLFSGLLGSEGGSGPRSRCAAAARDLPAPHTSITLCPAIMLAPSLVDITSEFTKKSISQMLEICHNILLELLKRLESALCLNNRFIERERELLMSGSHQLPLDKEYNLISHRELYYDERGIPARRALGLMSLLIQASNFTAVKVLSSNPTDVLDTVRKIIRHIEKQRRTLMFQGVLAGSVAVLRDLLKSGAAISVEKQTLMVDVLRWVVCARPGSLVLLHILQTLLAAEKFPHIINSLCQNSAEKTFKENTRHSIIQFTPDSCILQVLCSLLKAAGTSRKQQLTELLTLWVLSLFCGGQAKPVWLTAVPTAKSCQCHSLLCKLCFSLLSEACFSHPSASGADRQLLEKLLARGVLLMNIFMNEDQHLLAIIDPDSLGCYETFLHNMSESKITLDTNTRDILGFLCTQEELLKQPGNTTSDRQQPQLHPSRNLFIMGNNGKNISNVLNTLESL